MSSNTQVQIKSKLRFKGETYWLIAKSLSIINKTVKSFKKNLQKKKFQSNFDQIIVANHAFQCECTFKISLKITNINL